MSADLLRDAELCVKCGLCLEHCPTYQKSRNENESPRGRIALIQAWAENRLPFSAALDAHISNCLLCRSCERVCPAAVPYGRLVDEYRAQTARLHKKPLQLSLVKALARCPALRKPLPRLIDYYRRSARGASPLATAIAKAFGLSGINRLILAAPALPAPRPENVSREPVKSRVGLFIGCMSEIFDRETLNAGTRILTLAGYEICLPLGQTCCGALDLHCGDRNAAQQMQQRNIAAFNDPAITAVVTLASGCGAALQDYSDTDFNAKVVDFSRFLLATQLPQKLSVASLAARVLVHTPCSLANAMNDFESVAKLLNHIPGIKLSYFPEAIKCCGAAGSYLLDHAAMAQALLDDLLTVIVRERPNFVVTSNFGCAMHLRAGLSASGETIEVLHPAVLLERVLPTAAA